MTDKKLVELIKNGRHSRALSKLYKIYPAVVKHVKQSGGSLSDAEDVFQDAMVIFIEKAMKKDFELTASITTYVFGICKNLVFEKRREHQKDRLRNSSLGNEEDYKSIEDFLEEERRFQALDKVLIETGKKCLELLKMFYYDKLSMKTIAQRLGFKGETSAKTQKYKCIEKARNLTESVLIHSKNQSL